MVAIETFSRTADLSSPPKRHHQVEVDASVGPLVDAEDHVLKILGSRAGLDLSGFSRLRSLGRSPILEAGPEVGPVHLELPVHEPNGLVLELLDRPPEVEEEAVGPVVRDFHPLGDVVVAEPELEPEEELIERPRCELARRRWGG